MISRYQVNKLFFSRWSFASASSARNPCHFGSQADFAISVFWEVRIKKCASLVSLLQDVPNLCHEKCSVSSRLSMNSSNHSERSRKRSSASRLSSLFLFFWFLRMIRTTLVGLVRHFAHELDLLTSAAMSMLPMSCSQNWWITLEQQVVRSCPCCIKLSSTLWSTVVFDR